MSFLRPVTLIVAAALAALFPGPAVAQDAQEWPDSRLVAEGLEFPSGMVFLPDGTLLINDRPGFVRVFRDGELDPDPLAEVPTTLNGETGLLGIAIPPDVARDEAAYVFATAPDGASNIVWRVPLDGGDIEPVIQGLPAAVYHNGGGVAFDEDGMLLVSNGEQHDTDRAQDPEVLGGKVYRFTREGEVPRDNPFSATSAALSIGHRNPYGLAIDPLTGTAWVTENGPQYYDEINRIVPGANYGWPGVVGPEDAEVNEQTVAELGLREPYVEPVLAYEGIIVPTGITFATRGAPPIVQKGDLFFGAYSEDAIHHVRLNEDRDEAVFDEVIEVEGDVVAVAWGPDGLYYSAGSEVRMFPFAQRDEAGASKPSPAVSDEPSESPSPSEPARPLESLKDEEGGLAWPALLILALFGFGIYLSRRRLGR